MEFGNKVKPTRKVETRPTKIRVPLISILPRFLETSFSESIRTHLRTTTSNITIKGTIDRNVICQLKYSIIAAPNPRPITAPAEKTAVKIPCPIASFSLENFTLIIAKATGNMARPVPWIILDIINIKISYDKPPKRLPVEYITITITNIFFFP
jgi:hypothetical protein